MLPTVAVLIPTYNRRKIVQKTVDLLQDNLKYEGTVEIFVGDDSDDRALRFDNAFSRSHPHRVNVYWHEGERYGLGRNLNSLLQEGRDWGIEYYLSLDDDHWLNEPLDITPHVRKLMEDETAGAIRLYGVAGHRYEAELDGLYWRIKWDSPELYIASFRPHLKHIRFHQIYGYLPEGLKTGHTEESFCHTCKDIAMARPDIKCDVLIPLDVSTESGWDHVGHSWQLEGL